MLYIGASSSSRRALPAGNQDTRAKGATDECRRGKQGARLQCDHRQRQNAESVRPQGQAGGALLLSQGRHVGLHCRGLRLSRFAAQLRQGQGSRDRRFQGQRRAARQVQEEVRPYLPAGVGRERQDLREVRHLGGKEPLWPQVHGHRARHLPDRQDRHRGQGLVQGEGARPCRRRAAGREGAVTELLRFPPTCHPERQEGEYLMAGNVTVLIAGAGPVGLTLANELTRYGISVRIVDKAAERTDKSKALVLWSRTLELFDHGGYVDEFLAAGMPAHGAQISNGKSVIARISLDDALAVGDL